MLKDRHGLLRRLRRLDCTGENWQGQLAKIEQNIKESQQLAKQRQETLPQPNFDVDLPISKKREEILDLIRRSQVVIIAGETGSGKTTQIPKMCLELGLGCFGYIGHTQPRRIAARSIAERVAAELNSELGRYAGYKVRFSDHVDRSTHIKLMTDGILLAEIQNDRYLNAYDTIIIDEAHERSLNIDFLLGYIKLILPKRPDLKVIITSATIDTQRFSTFFNQAPVIEVSGRAYPVHVLYHPLNSQDPQEQDRDLQQGILDAVDELSSNYGSGDILVFLSGEREIRDTAESLRKHHPPHTEILPLYSRLSVSEQNKVFRHSNRQRIVLATNVAETSLTVPGIKYVVDPGTARISRYSYRSKVQRLPIEKVSQSSANQRKGRCGRVSEGVCIRLYSEEDFLARDEFTEPEIRRTNLAAVILQMEYLKIGSIDDFPFLQGPDYRFINDGYKLLLELQAVDQSKTISALGRQIVKLPIDPKLARVLVAAKDQNCMTEALIISSALSCQDPRDRPIEHQNAADQAHKKFAHEASDFLFYVNLWQELAKQKKHLSNNQFRKYCRSNFLNFLRIKEWQDLHRQLKQSVKELGWQLNQESADYANIHIALLSGLLGNIGFKSDTHSYSGQRNITFYIHPASSLSKKSPKWVTASEIVETSKLYARNVAKIEPFWIERTGAHLLKKSFHDIHWEKRAGHVVAHESATLYGLTIYSRKRVDYSPTDSALCRELFIQCALVDGDWNAKYDFVKHNVELLKQVAQEEAKIRRRDILVDKQHLEEFFANKLPLHVNNAANFKKWYAKSEENTKRGLFFDKKDLIRQDSVFGDIEQFPNTLNINGKLKLELNYCFEPGNPADGVTVNVPAVMLDQLDTEQFDYLVPGLLKEKIVTLIKSLPKAMRKSFVPVPQYADACLQRIGIRAQEPLLKALSQELLQMSGVKVALSDWQTEKLPPQYFMNFRVLDSNGQVIAEGRDLELLKSSLAHHTQNIIDDVGDGDSDQLSYTQWDFDDLPEETMVRAHGRDVTVYPALVDSEDSVYIKMFSNKTQAQEYLTQGVYRLFLLENNSNVNYLRKNIPDIKHICMLYSSVDSCENLREEFIEALVKHLLFEQKSNIRQKHQFREISHHTKEQLISKANELAKTMDLALSNHKELRQKLKLNIAAHAEASVLDITNQLDWLIYPGFLLETPFQWLVHLPRFLQAMLQRLEKLGQAPENDLQRLQGILPYWDKLVESYQEYGLSSEWINYRWMLEEMRVSVFAQQLKTSIPISYTRLDKQWSRVRNL